jgi:DNA topoisomerase-1
MYLRTGKRGLWLGCSKFPKCRGRLSWNTLDPETQARWEKIMNDHMAAHPVVTIMMLDGKPAPMNLPIEDIILRAEDAGLISAASEQQEAEATA